MRSFRKNSGRGFTLIELFLVIIVFAVVAAIAIAIAIAVVYVVVHINSERTQESSAIEMVLEPEVLAATDDGTNMNCLCLLRDQTQCVQCAVADATTVEIFPSWQSSVTVFDSLI